MPPKRELVALPPQPKASLHAEGRFTVLSYNILADLYATVRRSPPHLLPDTLLGVAVRRPTRPHPAFHDSEPLHMHGRCDTPVATPFLSCVSAR